MDIIRDYSVFDPLIYLHEYYAGMPPENLEHLKFLVDAFAQIEPDSLVLDFGGGPSLYSLIPAVGKAREIHYSDYLTANRAEVEKWLSGEPDAFDWRLAIQTVLELEGGNPSSAAVARREQAIRQKVTRSLACDVTMLPPLDEFDEDYDVIVSNLCVEAVAADTYEYHQYIRHLSVILKPGGQLIMVASKGTQTYGVGEKAFPVVYLVEDDVFNALVYAGFVPDSIQMSTIDADHPIHRYLGLICITARKG